MAAKLISLLLTLLLSVSPALASAEAEPEKEEPGPKFVNVGPVEVPVLKNGKVIQYVGIRVALEVPDKATADEVSARIPALNDAYITMLYGAFAVGDSLKDGLVDVDKMRVRLEQANLKVLPHGIRPRVLLQMVHQSQK